MILKNFDDVLAAQVPPGSIVTSVACGPDCPRLKDCPGLGNPNTLKLSVVLTLVANKVFGKFKGSFLKQKIQKEKKY